MTNHDRGKNKPGLQRKRFKNRFVTILILYSINIRIQSEILTTKLCAVIKNNTRLIKMQCKLCRPIGSVFNCVDDGKLASCFGQLYIILAEI